MGTKSHLGTGQIACVLGTDESEVKRVALMRSGEMTPPGSGDFGCEVISGVADNVGDAVERIERTIEALLTFPFFGGEKLVWFKNVSFLVDDVTGRSQAVTDGLAKLGGILSEGIPAGTRFLLSATGADKRKSFYKGLIKLGKVEVYDKVDASKAGWEREASVLVQECARGVGLRVRGEALELLTLFTGGDRRVIGNELEKLDIYLGAGEREVGVELVRQLVPLSRAGIVFELGNALAERNLTRSLGLLDQLLFQGESAIGILLVAIIPTVRNLLMAKDLVMRHRLSRPMQAFDFGRTLERLGEEATAHLPRKKDGTLNTYALGIAAMHVQRYEIGELREAMDACLSANIQLVSSGGEAEVVLSQLLVRLIAP